LEDVLKRQTQADALTVGAMLASQPAKDDLLAQQQEVELKLASCATLQQEVEKELSRPSDEQPTVSPELVSFHPALGKVLQAIADARLKVNAATANYTDDKQLQAVQDELKLNLAELRAELSRGNDSLRQQVSLLSSRQKQLADARKAQQARASALADQATKYQVLRERLAAAQADMERARSQEPAQPTAAAMAVSQPARDVLVLEPASLCSVDQPCWPNMRWLMLIALLAGLPIAAAVKMWSWLGMRSRERPEDFGSKES
jgi:uncharacterized protein involved in exopolysaccharide biosynthesis